MSWNYRRFHQPNLDTYFIGEAYYDDNGDFSGGYSLNYEGLVSATTKGDLREQYELIGEAFSKPVIELPELEKENT